VIVCRKVDDKNLLMKISIDIEKDVLFMSYGIHYKYVIVHSNGKCTWEFVPSKVLPGDYANRILSLRRDQIQNQQLTGM